SQEREPATNQTTRASRATEPRDSQGEGLLRRASDLARARTEELRLEDIAFREREATVATRQGLVRATDREMEAAIQSTKQAVRECKQLEQDYEQAIERKDIARELDMKKAQAKDYEQDILSMDRDYEQALQQRDMEQELDREEFDAKEYEQDYGDYDDRDDYDEPSR
ncbi:MAG: hypothetical protein JNM06_15440, partial [Blastocatellia bacterium]|nr:hypothetical protein [Blastocatellia bacterium]